MLTSTFMRSANIFLLILLCLPLQAGPQWVFNEILADPGAVNDSNNNGSFDPVEDEFLELINLSGDDADISGWTISDLVRVRHVFPEGTVVPADCAVVVFGSGPLGPSDSGALRLTSSSGILALNNGGDTLTLSTEAGAEVAIAAAYCPSQMECS